MTVFRYTRIILVQHKSGPITWRNVLFFHVLGVKIFGLTKLYQRLMWFSRILNRVPTNLVGGSFSEMSYHKTSLSVEKLLYPGVFRDFSWVHVITFFCLCRSSHFERLTHGGSPTMNLSWPFWTFEVVLTWLSFGEDPFVLNPSLESWWT